MKLRIVKASQGYVWLRQGLQVSLRQSFQFVGLLGLCVSAALLLIGLLYAFFGHSLYGKALRATAQALLDWLQARPDTSLTSLAATLQLGRNGLRHRLGFVAHSIGDLCDSLSAFVQGRPDGRWVQGVARQNAAEPVRATDPAEQAQAWVKGHAVAWPQRPVGLARLRLPPTAAWFEFLNLLFRPN